MPGTKPLVLTGDPARPQEAALAVMLEALGHSGVVVVPTDSLYGVGCLASPHNPALERVFCLKGRSRTQALPLLLSSAQDLSHWAQRLSPAAKKLAQAFWPGALTLVVEASAALPRAYWAPDGSVGLRVAHCALVQELVERAGWPLALTSANLHGKPAATSARELSLALLSGVDVVFDGGPAPLGSPSTVVDTRCSPPVILRQGVITAHELTHAICKCH